MDYEGEMKNSGVTFLGLLTILFIALKLCGVIAWSWWCVLSPLIAYWAILALAFCFGMLIGWIDRPRTPAEKLQYSLERMRQALKDRE